MEAFVTLGIFLSVLGLQTTAVGILVTVLWRMRADDILRIEALMVGHVTATRALLETHTSAINKRIDDLLLFVQAGKKTNSE